MNPDELVKEIRALEVARSKEPGKSMGICDSCGQDTVLVKEVGLCGPCCFGEAETIMGNW
jgi:hypothetical protein